MGNLDFVWPVSVLSQNFGINEVIHQPAEINLRHQTWKCSLHSNINIFTALPLFYIEGTGLVNKMWLKQKMWQLMIWYTYSPTHYFVLTKTFRVDSYLLSVNLTWCVPIWLWWFDRNKADSGSGGALPFGLWCGHHSKRPLEEPRCSASGCGHCGSWGPGGQRCVGLRFGIIIYAICPCGSPVDKSGHCGSPALLRLVIAVPFELPPGSKQQPDRVSSASTR